MKTAPVKILKNNGADFEIPLMGMGTFGSDKFPPEQVAAAVRDAAECGYRLFDCASVYGNENLIGEVFDAVFKNSGAKREEFVITSKVWNDMHGRGDVLLSCAKSLKDLRLDYIDIYFVHWPFPNYHAPGCDGDARNPDSRPFFADEFMECWRRTERLYDMGLARSIGMSNMTKAKLDAVLPLCRIKPMVIEMELHPAFQQEELYNYCVEKNIQPVGYCPVGSPNRPERDKAPDDVAAAEMPEIIETARAHKIHPAAACLKWAVQRGQIPIPFSVNNYKNNLISVFDGDLLTPEEMEKIRQADKNCRLVKGQVFLWEGASDWRALWDEDGVIPGWGG